VDTVVQPIMQGVPPRDTPHGGHGPSRPGNHVQVAVGTARQPGCRTRGARRLLRRLYAGGV